MQVSPPDGTHHWWCDVAVDGKGMPHVVWCNSERGLVYYSYRDSSGWVGPFAVNDTTLVGAAGWAAPRIIIDNTGLMHVCYTGVATGATGRDIFYARNDGNGWTPSVRVTQDTLTNHNEWYSDLDADGPDNVWVAWDRQNEGSDQFRVYASHFDGNAWSAEERLDGDSAYYDGCPDICLDAVGNPWVAWIGITYGTDEEDVYFNRYTSAAIAEVVPRQGQRRLVDRATSISRGTVDVVFSLQAAGHTRLEVFDATGRRIASILDEVMSAGRHEAQWRAGISVGTYVCRLQALGEEETWKIELVSH